MNKRIAVSHMYHGKSLFQRLKNRVWWTIVRRMRGAPEKFFYFPSSRKWDYEIRGYHWSGEIRIFRRNDESYKSWTAFCFKMVYNSRQNKGQAGQC